MSLSDQSRASVDGVMSLEGWMSTCSVLITAPAALGLDAAHGGHTGGESTAHAVAMRRLVKAILGRHRADLDGFEQDVVAGIS